MLFRSDRLFHKKNFYPELKEFFGNRFNELKSEQKEVLNAIYLHKHFSLKNKVSANLIGNFLFYKSKDGVIDLKEYDSYKRKTRTQFNKLEEAKFLLPVKNITTKGNERTVGYNLNGNLKNAKTLFD